MDWVPVDRSKREKKICLFLFFKSLHSCDRRTGALLRTSRPLRAGGIQDLVSRRGEKKEKKTKRKKKSEEYSTFSLSTLFPSPAMDDDRGEHLASEALTAALGAPLLERAAALGSLISTLWPELLQLSGPAKVSLATIGEGEEKRIGSISDF